MPEEIKAYNRGKVPQDDTKTTVDRDDAGRPEGGLHADPGRQGQKPGDSSKSDRISDSGLDKLSKPTSVTKSVRNDNKQEQSELEDIEIEDVSVFDRYVPSVFAEGSGQHPANIVESAAMALVKPPKTDYQVSLEKNIIKNLSDVQSEAVIMAGAAFLDKLPNGETKGFALGDGTGVGKGRTIAGIMKDWYNKGHKKSVWVTETGQLEEDSRRDIKDIGWEDANVLSTAGSKIKLKDTIPKQDGILFTTYNTLKTEKNTDSRLEQLVNWLGKDFDGVIAFDESHNMGNAYPMPNKKASQKALAGVKLQQLLPKAKILYVSATFA